jgi:hypothetical protein
MYEDVELNQATRNPARTAWAGIINNTPLAEGDDIHVVIPGISRETKWGPVRWSAHGVDLPSKGDDALVIFDDNKIPWVADWWPYG